MGTPPVIPNFIDELKWRGLFHQCTDEAGLRAHLADPVNHPRRGYVGFDPTADSLTIGNLVPIMMLAHFQRAGHQPVVVMGGGTGLIGDPSGKSAERQLQTVERVEANINAQRPIFEHILAFGDRARELGVKPALLTNNIEWLGKLGYIEVLRDIGKHFSVNAMIQKDSVRERLHNRDQGISYTEFSYMVLQAYDFLHLWRDWKQVGLPGPVTLQMGGSDQWGNIVGGCDLIRRELTRINTELAEAEAGSELSSSDERASRFVARLQELRRWIESNGVPAEEAFGLTAPLVTKADGGKFGKTESGAIWLTAARTSPYAYYQFWLNAADADVGRFLRIFTFLSREEIEALEAEQARDPAARPAQRALAREATRLLHGQSEMEAAERAAKALFSGDLAGLSERLFEEVLAAAPATDHDRSLLGPGLPLLDLLPQTSLAKSKSEAREFLSSGSVSVNGQKAPPDRRLTTADLLHGRYIALRRGKKSWHVTRWS